MKKIDTKNEIRNNYLFVKVTGHFDVNHIRENVCKTGEMLHSHNLKKIFIDITEETYTEKKQKSVFKMYDIASLMFETHPLGTKVCFLVRKDQLDENEFFDTAMTNQGFFVKITTNREEGLTWLGVLPEEKL